MKRRFKTLVASVILALSLFQIQYSQALTNIDSSKWKLSDKGVHIVKKDNQEVFKLTSGKLTLLDQQLMNGTIEFEMMSEGDRAFVYAYFREQGRESEHVYLRTHKSNSPDTLQYSPVFQGRSAWQIYHGSKGTATASLPANQWIKVKVSFYDDYLNMWVGDHQTLVFNDLSLTGKKQKGSVSLRGFIPNGSEAKYSAYIKNISIESNDTPATSNTSTKNSNSHFLTTLNVSPVFEATKDPLESIPESLKEKDWSVVTAQEDGIFEFLRSRQIPRGMRLYAVVAETMLRSNKIQRCQINLGFSDTISVLLNGKIIGHADHSYRYAQNRQQGVLHDKQLTLFLPLEDGENQLQMVVADSFGGWGLQVHLVDCAVD
ncbi:family 16 glycoside hydrolase [Agaribacter marinus]|uniref:3-keto-alpha-glucoside-1,2-lyase/3-keto-2-hydroxy-glucal hydratase domain-containing protein n=1 Tax=Agaribacter marinus TaxID=1431249 RepID=A0AA37T1K7_9ALTE|nr:family 16 glycoside hydrolase [Agaribacter marinus]GLR72150.1 hypothetical protein GCM10007852_30580 [Agaribacter marinus]